MIVEEYGEHQGLLRDVSGRHLVLGRVGEDRTPLIEGDGHLTGVTEDCRRDARSGSV